MTNEEIEKKIKYYKSQLKDIEISIAKDEERLKNKEIELDKVKAKIKDLYPEFDLNNIDEEIKKLESQLEGDVLVFESSLRAIEETIESNK